MTEPTTEMIDQWFRDAVACGDSPQHAYFSVANAAASWAREQALEEAAKVCEEKEDDYQQREGLRYAELKTDAQTGCGECAYAIRALKGKS